MKAMEQMDGSSPETQKAETKRQRFNQRPGRRAVVSIPIQGMSTPVEVTIVEIDAKAGTVELEIPKGATIGHRVEARTSVQPHDDRRPDSTSWLGR